MSARRRWRLSSAPAALASASSPGSPSTTAPSCSPARCRPRFWRSSSRSASISPSAGQAARASPAGPENRPPARRRRGGGCDNRRMSFEWVTPGLLGLLVAIVLWIALRPPPGQPDAERQARDLRDEIARSAQVTRQEIVATLGDFQRTLLAQQGDVSRTQNELIEAFGRQLAVTQQQLDASLGQATLAQVEQARLARDSLDQALEGQGTR